MSVHQIFPPPREQILQPTKNVVTFDKYPIFSRVKLKLMAGPLEFELNKKRLFDHCPEMPHFSFSRYNILAQYKNGKKLLFPTRNSQKHAKHNRTKSFLSRKLLSFDKLGGYLMEKLGKSSSFIAVKKNW